MVGSPIVNQTNGMARVGDANSAGTSYIMWRASGLYISQPVVDSTPYRVKAYVATKGDVICHLVVGYGPKDPTGIDDLVERVVSFPLDPQTGQVFDEVINMPGIPLTDTYSTRPIAFGIADISNDSLGRFGFFLSVQNLAKTAPTFAASMS